MLEFLISPQNCEGDAVLREWFEADGRVHSARRPEAVVGVVHGRQHLDRARRARCGMDG